MLRGEDQEFEVRTTGVTPAPSDLGQNQQPIIPAVFPQAAAAFLGISQPTVGIGDAVYYSAQLPPRLRVRRPRAPDQDPTAAAFTVQCSDPFENSGLALLRFGGCGSRLNGMAATLRRDLSQALSDKLDNEVFNRALDGLFVGTNLANNNTNAVDTFATYRKRFAYDAIDGKWASRTSDLRILVGADTYGSMGEKYRGSNSDQNALDSLTRMVSGIQV